MGYSLCIALFDERIGPYVAVKRGEDLNQEDATLIAVKTLVSAGSAASNYQETESILAMPEISRVLFFRYFPIAQGGKRSTTAPASLIFVTNVKDQLKIYQDAPKLSQLANIFIAELNKAIKEQTIDDVLPRVLEETIPQGKLDAIFYREQEIISELTAEHTHTSILPSLSLWKDFRGVDRLVRALILGERVIFFVRGRGLAQLEIATALSFCIHRSPLITEWTETIDPDAEIQCCPPNLSKGLPSGYIVVHQKAKNVRGGSPNSWCRKFYQDLSRLSPENAKLYALKVMDELIFDLGILLSQLDELLREEENSNLKNKYNNLIREFKKGRSKDELSIIEAIMTQSNYSVMNRIKETYRKLF